MQIVINISEQEYELAYKYPEVLFGSYGRAIAKGTPLPKGHGRLIDADDVDNHIIGHVDTRSCPTIIEADKEVDE